ncbi:MAG: hypothetical protein Q8R49_05535 [Rhodoferax sp.]|nr:hypothetical protein [Rhodoferax sp.]
MAKALELSRRHLLAGTLPLPLVGTRAAAGRTVAEVWKAASCGCCKDWTKRVHQRLRVNASN